MLLLQTVWICLTFQFDQMCTCTHLIKFMCQTLCVFSVNLRCSCCSSLSRHPLHSSCSTIRILPLLLSTGRLYFTSAHRAVTHFMIQIVFDTWKRMKICVSCKNCEFVRFWRWKKVFSCSCSSEACLTQINLIRLNLPPNAAKQIKTDSKLSNWHKVDICASVE